jgi:hypothetical protein
MSVYCQNHTKHIKTLCRQDAELWNVKLSGTYSSHCAIIQSYDAVLGRPDPVSIHYDVLLFCYLQRSGMETLNMNHLRSDFTCQWNSVSYERKQKLHSPEVVL